MQTPTKAQLTKLRKLLMYGNIDEIAKKTKYTRAYVSNVLSGTFKLNNTNAKILEEAIKLAEVNKDNRIKQINKIINLTEAE